MNRPDRMTVFKMIVFCEDCGKRYRIDPNKIKKPRVTFHCKECGHPITVTAPKKTVPEGLEKTPQPAPAEEKKQEVDSAVPAISTQKKPGVNPAIRMTAVLALIISVPILLGGGVWLRWTDRHIRSQIVVVEKSLPLSGNLIDEWMEAKFKVLELTAHIAIRNLMGPLSFGAFINTDLTGMADLDPVFFLHADGRILSGTGIHWPALEVELKQSGVLELGSSKQWQAISPEGAEKRFAVFYMPIYKDDKIVGYVGGGKEARKIQGKLSGWMSDGTGTPLLLDFSGRPLLGEDSASGLSPEILQMEVDAKLLQPRQRDPGHRQISIGRKDALIRPLRYGGGLLYVPKKPIGFFRGIPYLIGYGTIGLVLILVILCSYLYVRSRLGPVMELSRAAERFSLGDLQQQIPVDEGGEFGELTRSVSRIAESLRILMERMDAKND